MNEQNVKECLLVQNGASTGLNILYIFFKVLVILKILLGGITLFVFIAGGLSDIDKISGVLIGLGIILWALIDLIFLQFLNSLIKRTKAAEYYIAKIEKEFMIK